jgi:hypothetical protein
MVMAMFCVGKEISFKYYLVELGFRESRLRRLVHLAEGIFSSHTVLFVPEMLSGTGNIYLYGVSTEHHY